MATGTQLKAAVRAFIDENAALDDALEDKGNVRATVHAKEVFKQISMLESQIARSGDVKSDPDLELAQAHLLGFRAALLRSIAVGGLSSGNHVWEREARNEHAPRAIEAYEKILSFSNGDYVMADTLYQLGWLHRATGNREAALKYFRDLAARFPEDPNFGAQAALRIVELEGEQQKAAERSGFTLGLPAGRPVSCERALTLWSWHLPLQCAAWSIQWLLGQLGHDVPRGRIDAALGGRFLPRSGRIAPALTSLGLAVSQDPADALVDEGEGGLLLVCRRAAVSIEHVVALHRAAGVWTMFDPGNLLSRLYVDVSREQLRELRAAARLVIGVR